VDCYDPDTHIASKRIQVDIASLEDRAQRAAGATQQGLGAGDELADGKGLHQIVVRTAVQPAHAVFDGIARRQDQDGNGVASFANLAEEMETVAVR
jgi:hypothetical protein